MDATLVFAMFFAIAVIVLVLRFSIKKCCKTQRIRNVEGFIDEPVQGLMKEASALQQAPLPMGEDLAEMGGAYDAAAGIQSPSVNPKDDPWLRRRSYL